MLEEAVLRSLFAGGCVHHTGGTSRSTPPRSGDLPEQPAPISVAVSGRRRAGLAGELADLMIATDPDASVGEAFAAAGGAGNPRYGQLAVSYDPDVHTARRRAWSSSAGSPPAGR